MTIAILITNLSGVNIDDVRINAHALLLEDEGPPIRNRSATGPRYRLRGFGVEAGEVMFGMRLPSVEYVFERDPTPDIVARLGGDVLSTHGTLRVVDEHCCYAANKAATHEDDYDPCSCAVLHLDCDSQDGQAISFERFECEDADTERMYRAIWARLHANACHYRRAPFTPIRSMVATDLARRGTNEDRRSGNPWLVLPRSTP